LNKKQAFDVTRKETYDNLINWLTELRTYCENIPVIVGLKKNDKKERK